MISLVSLECEQFKSLREVKLRFPERGSVLIEGNNEAGKSTLFEAVFFALYGRALVGELGDLPAHGQTEATVRLAHTVNDTTLSIERRVQRTATGGRQPRVRLRVESPSTEPEEITAVDAMNRRLVMEMGGLDSDSLLNSCFVEQKKLERLENLGRQGLQASLLKLLNLERLTRLQQEFKVTARDAEAIGRAEKRLELAQATAEIPQREAERRQVEAHLRAIALRRHAEDAEHLTAERANLDRQRASAQARIRSAQARLERHDALQRAAADADAAHRACTDLARLVQERTDLEERARQLDERARTELPERTARVAAIGALDRQASELAGLDRQAADAAAHASECADAVAQYRADERQHAQHLEKQQKTDAQLQELDQQIGAADAIATEMLPAAEARLEQLGAAAVALRELADLRNDRQTQQDQADRLDERLRSAKHLRAQIAPLDADIGTLRQ